MIVYGLEFLRRQIALNSLREDSLREDFDEQRLDEQKVLDY